MTTNPTPNYGFSRPNFNQVTWHDDINDNWTLCDALFKAVGITSVVGAWQNNTAYTIGERVIDATDGTTWKCEVNHTSAAVGTFAADRAANPTYWESVVTGVIVRGAFVPGATYLINEFVYDSDERLAGIVEDAFVGGATLRDNIADLGVIVDFNADLDAIEADIVTLFAADAAINASLAGKANLAGGNAFTGNQTITGGDVILGGHIYKTTNNATLVLAGGNTGNVGANIELNGGAHATQANNAFIDADVLNIRSAAAGANRVSIHSASVDFGIPARALDGSAAAPAFSFFNDTDLGIYRSAENTIAIATGGTQKVSIGAVGKMLLVYAGDITNPAISIGNDPDTGIYLPAAENLAFVTNAVERARFNGTSFLIGATSGWNNGDGGSERGINLTTNGGLITSNDSTPTGNFRRRGTAGRLLNFYHDGTTSGGVDVNGAAATFVATSDETMKTFGSLYDPQAAIQLVKDNPVHNYTWNSDGKSGIGWGAQTTFAIEPSLVSVGGWFNYDTGEPSDENDPNAYYQPWGLNMSGRIPYLWAASNWLIERAEDFEARIAALESV